MKNSNMKKVIVIALALALTACCLFAFAACDVKDGRYFFEDGTRFKIDPNNLRVMGMELGDIFGLVSNLALNTDETYFEFNSDGTLHAQLTTKDGLIGTLPSLLNSFDVDLDSMLGSVDLAEGLATYVEPMFPGFTAYLEAGDLESSLALVERSIGLNIKGLDYEDEGIKEAVKYVGENKRLPGDLLDKIPADTVLQLTLDTHYLIRDIVGEDGTPYTAIYLGNDVANRNTATNPFCVFTLTENEAGVMSAEMVIEFLNVRLGIVQQLAE